MQLSGAGLFFGRLHPLLVHLPIGVLVLAVLFAVLSYREKYASLRQVMPVVLFAGFICAALSCVTGYLLATGGDYDDETVSLHRWLAIGTTLVSLVAYLFSRKDRVAAHAATKKTGISILLVLLAGITLTGHYGATLTHCAGYLSTDILFDKAAEKKHITDINHALVYDDLVQPVLTAKCGSCHNSSKRKGGLSMHTLAAVLVGGKHGAAIKPGDALGSLVMKRVTLDPKDEKFMPADNKPPLTETEKKLISWWVDHEAETAGKTAGQVNMPADLKVAVAGLLRIEKNSEGMADSSALASNNYVANLKLANVNEAAVNKLKQAGFRVKFIHLKPVLLDISLPASTGVLPSSSPDKMNALLAVKDNVLWLNLSGNSISDKQLDTVSRCTNLQRLRLDNNPVTDKGITRLQGLQNLESINLCNTKITGQSLPVLAAMHKLLHIYVWQTAITPADISSADTTGLRFIAGAAAQ